MPRFGRTHLRFPSAIHGTRAARRRAWSVGIRGGGGEGGGKRARGAHVGSRAPPRVVHQRAHLPAKTEMVVFCRPTETQRVLYEEGAKTVRDWTSGSSGGVRGTAAALCAIGLLRQLANSVDQAVRRAKTGKTAFKRSGGDCSRASKRARVEDDERNEDDDDDNSGVMSDGDGDDDDTNLKGGDGAAEGAEDLRATLAASALRVLGGVEGSGNSPL